MLIDPSIIDFYTQGSEETRLQLGLGPLEFLRSKQLISRYLPDPPAVIADIGGATGHYAAWLAGMGYHVVLIDPIEKHLKQAQKRATKNRSLFRCLKGEARKLPMDTSSVDLVILHGPLYHLQEASERIAALKEARRILKYNGIILGFAINHVAPLLAALQNGMIYEQDMLTICLQTLQTGEQDPPPRFAGMLPEAYFHQPEQLADEFETAGFKKIGMHAVEGAAWLDGHYFTNWSDPHKRQWLLDLLLQTESNPTLLGVSPHFMLAAETDWIR